MATPYEQNLLYLCAIFKNSGQYKEMQEDQLILYIPALGQDIIIKMSRLIFQLIMKVGHHLNKLELHPHSDHLNVISKNYVH